MLKALIALLVIIALSGCDMSSSSVAGEHHHKQHHAAAKPASSPSVDNEQVRELVFATSVHDKIPSTKVISDDKLVQLGHNSCDDFDNMHLSNLSQLYAYAKAFHMQVADYMSFDDTSWYLGTVIAAFCPKYESVVKGG